MSRQQEPRSERTNSSGRTVDARQLWSGGAATAVVAALIALAGILVCRWLFNIPVLAPRQDGAWGDASTAGYAIAAAAAALVALNGPRTATRRRSLLMDRKFRAGPASMIGLTLIRSLSTLSCPGLRRMRRGPRPMRRGQHAHRAGQPVPPMRSVVQPGSRPLRAVPPLQPPS